MFPSVYPWLTNDIWSNTCLQMVRVWEEQYRTIRVLILGVGAVEASGLLVLYHQPCNFNSVAVYVVKHLSAVCLSLMERIFYHEFGDVRI